MAFSAILKPAWINRELIRLCLERPDAFHGSCEIAFPTTDLRLSIEEFSNRYLVPASKHAFTTLAPPRGSDWFKASIDSFEGTSSEIWTRENYATEQIEVWFEVSHAGVQGEPYFWLGELAEAA